jgi:hypothetical protein
MRGVTAEMFLAGKLKDGELSWEGRHRGRGFVAEDGLCGVVRRWATLRLSLHIKLRATTPLFSAPLPLLNIYSCIHTEIPPPPIHPQSLLCNKLLTSVATSPCGKSCWLPRSADAAPGQVKEETKLTTPAQRNFRIHQLPGREGQEVHSQHTHQWQVPSPLALVASSPGCPSSTWLTGSLTRSPTPRVPRLRLRWSGHRRRQEE